jgi:hypothetical protein
VVVSGCMLLLVMFASGYELLQNCCDLLLVFVVASIWEWL